METFCGNTRFEGEMEWESKLTHQLGFHWLSRERDIWSPVKDRELNKHILTSTLSRNATK